MARTSLGAFLATARKALAAPASQRTSPLTFVVGNESADLDSLCSALVLAYFRTHAPPHFALHIPLAHLPVADLRLRPELDAALRATGVRPSELITLSDLPAGLTADNTRWLLVDHNALTGELGEKFASAVVGCVDHHADEGAVPQDTGDEPRVLGKCGSCMSLVVEHCKDVWDELAAESPDADVDAALARVALAPILVDTVNLESEEKRTEVDIKAVKYLEARIEPTRKIDRKVYSDQLAAAKEDISRFTYGDLLRKDYKKWYDGGFALGMSSVVQGLDYLLDQIGPEEKLLQAVTDFAGEQKLDLIAIMTVQTKDEQFIRELLVWALNDGAAKAMASFVDNSSADLRLERWQDGRLDDAESGRRLCWRQHKTAASRKQVGPMLREAMKRTPKV